MFSSSSPSLPSKTPVAVTRVSKRLVKELAQLQKNPPPSVAAWPVNDNPHKLNARQPLNTPPPGPPSLFALLPRCLISWPSARFDCYELTPSAVVLSRAVRSRRVSVRGRRLSTGAQRAREVASGSTAPSCDA